MSFRAFTIFAEHGRPDSTGNNDTLVGVFGASANILPAPPGQTQMLPLFAYTSIMIDRGSKLPASFSVDMRLNGKTVASAPIDLNLVRDEFERVKKENLDVPYAQIISRVVTNGMPIPNPPFVIEVFVKLDEQEIRSGYLKFLKAMTSTKKT